MSRRKFFDTHVGDFQNNKKTDNMTQQPKNRLTFRAYLYRLSKNKELILAPSVTMFPQLFFLPQFILMSMSRIRCSLATLSFDAFYFVTYYHKYCHINSTFHPHHPIQTNFMRRNSIIEFRHDELF